MTTPAPKPPLTIEETLRPLNTQPKQPIRLGIQSGPGEGKTWAALTFPNPIVLNLDNKLVGYQASNPDSSIPVVTFDREMCLKLGAKNGKDGQTDNPIWKPNARDAVNNWLKKFGPQLSPEQTLVLDSWTSLQSRFDYQQDLPHEQSYTKSGAVDVFFFWRMKLKYSEDIMDTLKDLRCNVVITFHETVERDDEGKLTSKLKPLMQGQFADKIASQMTDFYRQRVVTRDMKDYETIKKGLGRDIEGEREWLWHTRSSGIFTGCCSIPNMPAYVPANYSSLTKTYAREKQTSLQ